MVNELFLLLLRNFGITYLRILNLQTQLMILNANLKHFFLCELMNRDVFILYVSLGVSTLTKRDDLPEIFGENNCPRM